MPQEFRIEKRSHFIAGLILSFVLILLINFWILTEDSSMRWFQILWLILALFHVYRFFRSAPSYYMIYLDNTSIHFQKARGKKRWPVEEVFSVNDDQIAFHLFSKEDVLSVSKKRIPVELRNSLKERLGEQTSAL